LVDLDLELDKIESEFIEAMSSARRTEIANSMPQSVHGPSSVVDEADDVVVT
jgi:hypothetical protein